MINHPGSVVVRLACSDVLRGLRRGFQRAAAPQQSSIASATALLAICLLNQRMVDPYFTALALPKQTSTILDFANAVSFKTTARSRSF